MQQVKVPEHHVELLQAYSGLDNIRAGFNNAAQELDAVRGMPSCVENCGKCCQAMTPFIWDIEAHYIMGHLLGNGHLSRTMDRIESWLVDYHAGVTTYGLPTGRVRETTWAKVREEVQSAISAPCPLLGDDKRCLIHSCRPIACMAYGVTRTPAQFCPRPKGINESESTKAYFGGHGATNMQRMLQGFLQGLKPEYRTSWFLPTALLKVGWPERFNALAGSNKIASAKLCTGLLSPSIIWQEQLS